MAPFLPIEVPEVVTQLFTSNFVGSDHVTILSSRWVKIKRKSAGPVHYDGEPCMMDAELLVEVVPSGLKVLAAVGWDGTCTPVPLYRQFFDVVAGNVK